MQKVESEPLQKQVLGAHPEFPEDTSTKRPRSSFQPFAQEYYGPFRASLLLPEGWVNI